MDINGWTIAGVIIGALGVVAAVYFGIRMLRKQFPKRELRYTVRVIPLLSGGVATRHSDLKILLRGEELSEPYAVTVALESRSRADIPSASFDAERPISVKSTKPMHVSSGSLVADDTIGFTPPGTAISGKGATIVVIPPQLIRPKAFGFINAVTDGKPEITVESSLIDIAVKDATSAAVKPRVWPAVVLWLAAAALGAGIMILLGQLLSIG